VVISGAAHCRESGCAHSPARRGVHTPRYVDAALTDLTSA
jgi:hypothetical protein